MSEKNKKFRFQDG